MPIAFQPKQAGSQPPWVSVLDRLSPANTDLWEFLSNKRKLRSEKPVHILSSQCGHRMPTSEIHFVHYCLGSIPTPPTQHSVFNRLSIRTFEKAKSRKKKTMKLPDLPAVSINMINRGRDLLWPWRRRHGVNLLPILQTLTIAWPKSDYGGYRGCLSGYSF